MVQGLKALLGKDIISRPAHYIEGRKIEPICVIEEFGLCHHLACVVKYIARAGRKTSLLNDLYKAHWYLDREISRILAGVGPCAPPLKQAPDFKTDAICGDWTLSLHLREALSCILHYRLADVSHQSFQWVKKLPAASGSAELSDNAFLLVKAMDYLKLEIAAHSEENLDGSEQGGGK